MKHDFTIDPEFHDLLPAQTRETKQRLEKLIQRHGCRPGSLIVGVLPTDERILVDGHHTFEFCEAKNIPMTPVVLQSFESRADMREWMVDNQLSRRNLTDEQRGFFIGKKYLISKPEQGERYKENTVDTVSTIAERYGVSEKTVRRNAEFAEAVDQHSEPVKAAILAGEAGVSKKQVTSTPPDKLFCARCKRVGPTKGCAACKELRAEARKPKREPGDESERDEEKKASAKAKRNNGKPAYDDREIEKLIGQLVRALDDRAKVKGKSKDYKACIDAHRELVKAWKEWK